MFIYDLKTRYNRIYKAIAGKAQGQTILDIGVIPRYREFEKVVWLFSNADISAKYINTGENIRYRIFPIGNWVERPRAIISTA